ncbi:hypothetical protein HMPREF1883_02104 [Streptococcus agalactiae]|nr:hypothetical protein HMPREF1883_02104 [Streptococcus agalactiae]
MTLDSLNLLSFGTIRNSTALKLYAKQSPAFRSFGTIRNSTALKHGVAHSITYKSFGTIRNSTALKLYKRNLFY